MYREVFPKLKKNVSESIELANHQSIRIKSSSWLHPRTMDTFPLQTSRKVSVTLMFIHHPCPLNASKVPIENH